MAVPLFSFSVFFKLKQTANIIAFAFALCFVQTLCFVPPTIYNLRA